MDGQGTQRHRKIAENSNRLSRVHERYRQTDDRRQTDGRRHIANVNVSSLSLKITKIHAPSNLKSEYAADCELMQQQVI